MHIGYSFFYFPGALAGCNSASVGRDWEGSSTPHGWQKPPCFDRIQRGGEQVFQLCPCRERIKLCGNAAGWHRVLVRCVIMSIPAPMAPRICVAPVVLKEAPELITFSVHPLENYTSYTILCLGEWRWRTAQRYLLLGRRYIKALSVQFPCKKFRAALTGPGCWAEHEGKTEMSLQSRARQHQASGWDFRSSNCCLSPPICLCAGDTLPREANASSQG